MAINTNTNPYYNDFEDAKNYLQILFKPGYAVQARELTQLQTALQKQITSFGSHVFKDGSIVLNGNTTTTPCNWIDVLTEDGAPAVGETFVGETSGARGKVFTYSQVNSTTARLYFVYASGSYFEQDENIQAVDSLQILTIKDDESFAGTATAFSIEDSVFFVNGYFAFCEKQTHILNDTDVFFNRRVGLTVEEKIVTFQDDSTLLDPAQGSYNFSAPGADRIAISLTLSSFEYDPLLDELPEIDDFIELARFTDSVITFNQKTSTYNELEKTLARRTFDESGDYTVKAFSAKAIPHIGGDATKFSLAIGPGKAYVKGFEFETIATNYITVPRALDTKTMTNHSVDVSYGDYFVVKTPQNANLDYTANAAVEIVSNGTVIGTANVRNIETLQTERYKLFLYNIKIESAYAVSDITAFTGASAWYAEIDESYYTNGVAFEKAPNRTAIIKLPNSYVKTLLDESLQSNTEIESVYAYSGAINSSGQISISSGSGKTFISTFKDDYVVVNSTTGAVLPVSSVSLSGSTTANFTFATVSVPVTIYAPVVYANLLQKNKAIQSLTVTTDITSDKISLGYSDCYQVVSIIARNSEDPTSETEDVTAKFEFNNGQTDEFYDHGWVKLASGQSISATFDVIDIKFEYFSQNKNEGFFSVDSYPVSYENIPTYVGVTGEKYRLADCLDFRPRRENNATTFVGNGIAFPKSRISLDYEFYLPRVDKLILTKEKKFDVIKGVPSEQPRIPTDLYDAMTLYVLTLPAYTVDPSNIVMSYIDNKRYTMRDIGKISKRVEKIEYYTSLSLLEKQANEETLYNNLGVERFKNGILVDSFFGHSVGDVNSADYSCAINKESRLLRPRFSSWSYGYDVASMTTGKRGDLITLPITGTEILANQPFATNVVNVNPYLVFSWEGRVSLNPATDNWVDTQTRPDVVVNLNGENDVYTTVVPNVRNPASTGVVWNDWQTVVRGIDTTQTLTNQESSSISVIDGLTLETSTSAISSTIQTTTESSSYRTGIEISNSAVSTVQRDLGTKVVDTSIVPYIRSRLVDFAAVNMKPATDLYALFDNVQVSKYCTPAIEVRLPAGTTVPETATTLQTSGGVKSARILLARGNTVFVILNTGSQNFVVSDSVQWINTTASAFVTVSSVTVRSKLTTNSNGDIAGVFLIPNDASTKFTVGEKVFRLADNLTNRPNTAAEVKYVAQGLSQSLEKTLVSTRVASVSVNPVQQTGATVTDVATATATAVSQVVVPVDPIRIVCSEDENTGDFSNGQAKRSEYLLSYADTVTVSASGAIGSTNIEVQSAVGIKVGMKVSGTGIAATATVSSISGNVITLSSANIASVSGSLNATFVNVFSWIGIKYIPGNLPVKYTLYFDGKEYTTGYVGSSAYNSRLNSLGLPNVTGPGNGLLFLQRGDASFTEARLVVDSPLEGGDWQFAVPCPLQTMPGAQLFAPTYAISANKTSVSEGDVVTFEIKTTNVANGTVLNWEILGLNSGLNSSDFADGVMRGSVTINNNRATFSKTTAEDLVSDGDDSFIVDLREGTRSVAQSQSVLIRDTSLTIPSYFVSSDKAVISEGGAVTFNIATTGIPSGTVLYWNLAGTVSSQDFTDGLLQGSVTINNNAATVTKTTRNDLTTEGVEEFTLNLRVNSTVGSIVATSNNVSIIDTSITPNPTYSVLPSQNIVNEGQSVTYTVTTQNLANGTVLYWVATGLSSNDFADGNLSGSVTVNSNTGSFNLTLANDLTTEGDELLTVAIKTGSTGGTTVATAPTVTVRDTSTSTPTYAVTVDRSVVNEGETLNYLVTTTDVANGTTLYWVTSGASITTADFTDATLSGSVVVNNNTATFTRTLSNDVTIEGTEYLSLDLKTGSISGTTVANAPTVNIIDTSKSSTYSVSPNVTSVNEGASVTYTVTTTDVTNGTTLYWVSSGTNIAGSDFTDGQVSGSVVINNNVGTITRTLVNDFTSEGTEFLEMVIKTGSTAGTTVATSSTVNILDTSPSPGYSITPSSITISEGSTVTYTVATDNVANGTTLYWVSSGTNITGADFTDGQLSGTVVISNNVGSFTRTLVADATTEGNELLEMVLKTGSTGGTTVATAPTITIVDTSPNPTYRVGPSVTSLNEGQSVTYTVTTTDVPNNTTLYWVASGTGITTADFSDSALSGSVVITNNTGTFTRTLTNDLTTEGNEYLQMAIKTGSVAGTTVATAPSVVIVDSSTTAPTYAISASPLVVNEGGTVTYTVTTTGVANGNLYWAATGVSAGDFTDSQLTGTVAITSGSGTFTRTLTADATTEGTEYLTMALKTVSVSGTTVATSQTVTVNDTSTTAPTYAVDASTVLVNEGSSVTFNVTTTNVPNNTTLYWTTSGTTSAGDFVDGTVSGQVIINNNVGTITRAISNDLTTEGTETFTLSVRTGSISGTVVATSQTVSINDTSLSVPGYSVTANAVIVNEGQSVTFTVTTQNIVDNTTLYWTVAGTASGSDFTGGAMSGSFVVVGNTATITRSIAADSVSDGGDETFTLSVRTGSVAGTVVATSELVTIRDTSLPSPTYFVTSDKTTVDEGSTVTFTVNTTQVNDGTTLYWTVASTAGTVNSSDFVDNALSGSFVVNGGTATIDRAISADLATETTLEKFTLSVRTVSTSGTIVATSNVVTINDTSKTPTVNAAWTNSLMSEGTTNNCTITTTGYANNSVLYWTIEAVSGTFTAADFVDGSLSGSVTINNGTAVISKTAVNDITTEGNESFLLKVRSGSTSGTVLATTGNVTIVDTSVSPTYFISSDKTSINEGDSVTFTVTTTNVTNGTVLYWTTTGDLLGVNAADFTDNVVNGSVTINNNTATITRTAKVDSTLESSGEPFSLQLRLSSITGTIVATSNSVTIIDKEPTYAIRLSKTNVNEGETISIQVETTNIADGTTLYLAAAGTASSADLSVYSGSVVINNNTATAPVTILEDSLTEGTEAFSITLRTGSISGPVKATSQTVTINDTSLAPTYSVQPSVTTVNEGSTVTYTVTTTSVANGTVLYWVSSGLLAADFTDAAVSGSVTVSNNKATFTRTLVNDNLTEGSETLAMVIKTGSVSGTTVATSPTVTVLDTSKNLPTYQIAPNVTTVTEGSNVIFTVTTTNVTNGTVLYWNTIGIGGFLGISGIQTDDFSDGAVFGSVTINNNTASITRPISAADSEVEGTQAFKLDLLDSPVSPTSAVLASSATVSITNVTKVRNASVNGFRTDISYEEQGLLWNGSTFWVPAASDLFRITWSGTNFNPNTKYYVSSARVVSGPGTIQFPTTQVLANQDVLGTLSIPAGTRLPPQSEVVIEVTMTYASGDGVIDMGNYASLKTITGRCNGFITVTREVETILRFDGEQRGNDSDPVAQTFRIDSKLYPNGVFVSSLDLFFKSKSSSAPVFVELRPVVNGYPSSKTVIPFSTASLLPANVNLSENGTAATRFTFNNIVYLAPGEEYSFVVLADSDEYELFTAVLGEFTIQDPTKRVDKQPVLGSMFKSQNSSTWTAAQEEDVKFVLNKCVFTPNVAANAVFNTKVDATNGNVPYDLFFTTGENIDFAATNIDYEFNTGSGWVPYQLGSNVTLDEQKTLVASTPSSLQFKTTLSTTDRNITPVIDLNRLSNVLVHNVINNDATNEDGDFGGEAVAKYVTRKVKLAPGFDATDLKVYLFANLPSPSSIKVYYKVSVSTDPFFDDNQYVEMEVETAGTYSENSFVEYKYKTPFLIGEEPETETVAIASGDRFDTFAIKIVMLSPDSTKVPQIRDLRVIALDQ